MLLLFTQDMILVDVEDANDVTAFRLTLSSSERYTLPLLTNYLVCWFNLNETGKVGSNHYQNHEFMNKRRHVRFYYRNHLFFSFNIVNIELCVLSALLIGTMIGPNMMLHGIKLQPFEYNHDESLVPSRIVDVGSVYSAKLIFYPADATARRVLSSPHFLLLHSTNNTCFKSYNSTFWVLCRLIVQTPKLLHCSCYAISHTYL